MTVTETRPEHREGSVAPASDARVGGWLDSTDHKRIGRLFIFSGLLFLVVGGAAGVLLRGELAERGTQLLDGHYGRAFSLHATTLAVLFVPALWAGLASFLVPLQIGANRVAFPRLLSLSFWLHLGGGGLVVASYFLRGFDLAGITVATPAAARTGGGTTANDLWIAGMAVVAIAAAAVAVNLVVTVARLRAAGLTFMRLPMFTWSVVAGAAVTVLATPVFLAGLLLLWIDHHFGGRFFASPGAGVVWQHSLWLFGRPEAYLLVLPGLGAACDIVATHARRPLLGFPGARAALAAVAVLSFGAWAGGSRVARAIVVPTYSGLTALVVLPLGVLALTWLGTAATGRPRLHPSLLQVGSALALFAFAALNAAIAAIVDVTGTAWTSGFLHAALFGPALLLGAAALYHWAPKLWGRVLPTGGGVLVTLLLFGGSLINSGGSFLLGYARAPWHVDDLTRSSWVGPSRLAAAGGVLVALGVLWLVVEVVRAAVRGADAAMGADPYGGLTLEWATSSPPPLRNFDALPLIDSAHPLAATAGEGAPRTGGSD